MKFMIAQNTLIQIGFIKAHRYFRIVAENEIHYFVQISNTMNSWKQCKIKKDEMKEFMKMYFCMKDSDDPYYYGCTKEMIRKGESRIFKNESI